MCLMALAFKGISIKQNVKEIALEAPGLYISSIGTYSSYYFSCVVDLSIKHLILDSDTQNVVISMGSWGGGRCLLFLPCVAYLV